MEKFKWYLWQLIPCPYRSFYVEDGQRYFHVWKMWLGRCYDETRVRVAEESSTATTYIVIHLNGEKTNLKPPYIWTCG